MTAEHWRPVYIGIGSNLADPVSQVAAAMRVLTTLKHCTAWVFSRVYRSPPMGPQDQPEFANAVAGALTSSEPLPLLATLQAIEKDAGRVREGQRWGPRILDLDMLAVGSVCSDSNELRLPHPGISERRFVLAPWCDIAPHFILPGGRPVVDYLDDAPGTVRVACEIKP